MSNQSFLDENDLSTVLTLNDSLITSTSTTDVPNQKIILAGLLTIVIFIVIIGNTLVILAVITTRRLRTVTNCFVMSLAVADWLVGVFVMPPSIAYTLMGTWELGWILCDIWVSLDILLCTASILSLCVISLDRYLAVTEPLHYSRNRRSKRLAFIMILAVWVSSALITCPPMFGWYEPGRHKFKTCRYNRNTGYVIFSAMCSFFIPMVVMLYVYLRISCVIAQRHNQLSHIENIHGKEKSSRFAFRKSISSEDEHSFSTHHHHHHHHHHHNGSTSPTPPNPKHVEYKDQKETFPSSPKTPATAVTVPEHCDETACNADRSSRVSSFRRESKTAQTLSIVMGGFIVCWLPFFIFYISTPFIPNNSINDLIMSYLTWLGWFNSAINPFIYAFYSPDFRIAFWRLTIKNFSNTGHS